MSLTLEESFSFFKSINGKRIRKGVGVSSNGIVSPFFLKDLLLDGADPHVKGLATIETEPTVELAWKTKQFLDLSKVELSTFIFSELYYTEEHMVEGAPLVVVDAKQGGSFKKGTTNTITLKGRYLIDGITFSFPPEITVDNINFIDLETIELTFTDTTNSPVTLAIKTSNAAGKVAVNHFVIKFY